jgi:signal transduction histidine kinase
MARLGLVARVMLIVTIALIIIQLAAAAAYYAQRDGALSPRRAAAIGSVVALTELVDRLRGGDRALALRAVESGGVTATVDPQAPADLDDDVELVGLRGVLSSALKSAGLGERFVRVGLSKSGAIEGATLGPIQRLTGRHVRVVVGLADGEYLSVNFVDRLTMRLFGLPIGLIAGTLGMAVALLAIIAVAREMRPLSRLARAVETIGTRFDPLVIHPEGAREVRSLIAAINRMKDRIAALVNNRTLMLGAISHDLRTYLTRLRLRVELMADGPLREGAARDVEAMRGLVEDALLFARTSLDTDRGPSDAAAVAAEIIQARRAAGAGATLTAPPQPVCVPVGAAALRRVLDNLVDNALAYGGEAAVTVGQAGDGGVTVKVEDRGPGIPVGERERVFEPFYRIEASRCRDHGGTGLGLTIVQQLLAGVGATIAFADRPGGGLCVTVGFPPL